MFRRLTPFGNKAWHLGTRPRSVTVVSAGLDFNLLVVRLFEETESRVKGSILRQFIITDNYHGDAGRRHRKQGQGKHT